MARKGVTDEQYAAVDRRLDEVKHRTDEGALLFDAVMDGLRRIIEGKAIVAATRAEKPGILKVLDDVRVGPLSETFDHREFFIARKGLRVSHEFTNLIKRARAVIESPAVSLKCYELTADASDHRIKAELPQNHEVQLWQIAQLIEMQEGGTEGPLCNDDLRRNIFYVAGFVVSVHWHSYFRKWSAEANGLHGSHQDAGYRIFSAD